MNLLEAPQKLVSVFYILIMKNAVILSKEIKRYYFFVVLIFNHYEYGTNLLEIKAYPKDLF